jgi:hypothetical protein
MSNEQSVKQPLSLKGRTHFTLIIAGLSLALLIVSIIYSHWLSERKKEANMPQPSMETIVLGLRTFHQQTGRFPSNFIELDERVWKGARGAQISPDGKSLTAPQSHYYYRLHTINPPDPARATVPAKAGIWAVPTGERAAEAATYFWYVTPLDIERWMGPALTQENVGVVNSIPSEQQLALLVMTRQPQAATPQRSATKGIFSFFGF